MASSADKELRNRRKRARRRSRDPADMRWAAAERKRCLESYHRQMSQPGRAAKRRADERRRWRPDTADERSIRRIKTKHKRWSDPEWTLKQNAKDRARYRRMTPAQRQRKQDGQNKRRAKKREIQRAWIAAIPVYQSHLPAGIRTWSVPGW